MEETGNMLLQNLAREVEIMAGIFYVKKKDRFEATSTYAIVSPDEPGSFKEGEGLTGQVAKNRQVMVITDLPGDHLEVFSGLGKAKPAYLAIAPLVRRNRTVAVLECSGYRYDPHDIENMLRILSRDLMQKRSEAE
ncbi:MAG: GAF domain-containing protein [Bacteroidales bacterium]